MTFFPTIRSVWTPLTIITQKYHSSMYLEEKYHSFEIPSILSLVSLNTRFAIWNHLKFVPQPNQNYLFSCLAASSIAALNYCTSFAVFFMSRLNDFLPFSDFLFKVLKDSSVKQFLIPLKIASNTSFVTDFSMPFVLMRA